MNLNFASVWEMIADLIPDNDALICGEEVVNWRDYDLRSSKLATALVDAGLSPNSKAGLYLNNSNATLIIEADKKSEHSMLVDVWEIAQQAGIKKITIATGLKAKDD